MKSDKPDILALFVNDLIPDKSLPPKVSLIITTSLLEDIEPLQELMAHKAAGEERGCLMPISIDSGSSGRGKGVRDASGHFVCGRLSYWGGGLAMGGFYRHFSVRPHLDTRTNIHMHHKISDRMVIHTAVHFSTFMFIFGMFKY